VNIEKRTPVILGAAFVLGIIVAYPLLRSTQQHHTSNFDWLLWPGFIVSIPIYLLGGGVHGSGVDIWAWSVVPSNGICYALLVGLGMWIRRLVERKP
jgi:hypothetical protein